jgi:hypothetical protein
MNKEQSQFNRLAESANVGLRKLPARCHRELRSRSLTATVRSMPLSLVDSLRWFVSLCRVILDAAIGHMPMVRAEASLGGSDWCLRSLQRR